MGFVGFNIYESSSTFEGNPTQHFQPNPYLKDEIKDIVGHQIVLTKRGGYQRYLMKWREMSLSNCT